MTDISRFDYKNASMIEAVEQYMLRGMHVRLLKPKDKSYAFKNRIPDDEYYTITNEDLKTSDDITSFLSVYPDYGIGLDGKTSNMFWLDVDVHGEVNGIAYLKKLIMEGCIDNANTPIVESPTGGVRLLFNTPLSMKVRQGKLRDGSGNIIPGIEVIYHNGVLPPSHHPKGGRYKWTIPPTDEGGITPLPKLCTLLEAQGLLTKEAGNEASLAKPLFGENDIQEESTEVLSQTMKSPSDYPWTDVGNAKKFADREYFDLLYCDLWGKWRVWDGRRWKQDDTMEVKRRAVHMVESMIDELKCFCESSDRRAYFNHIIRSQSDARINALINLAKADERIAVTPDLFDQDPYKLNFLNGTLDLKTNAFNPHRREDRITKICNAYYDEAAECPKWQKCLDTWLKGNKEDILFLQKAIGYSLTGDTSEHVFFILFGTGRNGKTTFIDTVRYVLNDYSVSTPVETILQKRNAGIPNDVARLKGARFVTASEADEGQKLAESLIKQMTGGDTISARFLYGEFFDYKPEFKLWLATNHKPLIKGTDRAIWARVRLIPFDVMIPEEQRDKELVNKLRCEASGIANWMIKGYQLWKSEGHLKASENIIKATGEYKAEMDDLGNFLLDRCEQESRHMVYNKNLFAAYLDWCDAEGLKALSQKTFTLYMKERGFMNRTTNKGKIWLGLKLKEDTRICDE